MVIILRGISAATLSLFYLSTSETIPGDCRQAAHWRPVNKRLIMQVRLTFESLTLLGSVIYIVLALREILHQGYRVFFRTLVGEI